MKDSIAVLAEYFFKHTLCFQCPDDLRFQCQKNQGYGKCTVKTWSDFFKSIVKKNESSKDAPKAEFLELDDDKSNKPEKAVRKTRKRKSKEEGVDK